MHPHKLEKYLMLVKMARTIGRFMEDFAKRYDSVTRAAVTDMGGSYDGTRVSATVKPENSGYVDDPKWAVETYGTDKLLEAGALFVKTDPLKKLPVTNPADLEKHDKKREYMRITLKGKPSTRVLRELSNAVRRKIYPTDPAQ